MKLKTSELVICSLFASLTAILTQISIPLPAVPLTMQIFAVALCGLVLGKRLGLSYEGIEAALRDNIKLNLIEEHKIERWYGDLSILLEFIDQHKD